MTVSWLLCTSPPLSPSSWKSKKFHLVLNLVFSISNKCSYKAQIQSKQGNLSLQKWTWMSGLDLVSESPYVPWVLGGMFSAEISLGLLSLVCFSCGWELYQTQTSKQHLKMLPELYCLYCLSCWQITGHWDQFKTSVD